MDLPIAQKGMYTILLEAFMKARPLNLELLFDEHQALRGYLVHISNVPFGVPCFLDALCRLMDI